MAVALRCAPTHTRTHTAPSERRPRLRSHRWSLSFRRWSKGAHSRRDFLVLPTTPPSPSLAAAVFPAFLPAHRSGRSHRWSLSCHRWSDERALSPAFSRPRPTPPPHCHHPPPPTTTGPVSPPAFFPAHRSGAYHHAIATATTTTTTTTTTTASVRVPVCLSPFRPPSLRPSLSAFLPATKEKA